MLEHLGEVAAADAVITALAETAAAGVRTADVGGSATTVEVGDAVAARVSPRRSPPRP